MPRLRLTIVLDYDADPQHYGTEDPKEMAKIDQANYEEMPENLLDLIAKGEYEVGVEPVKPLE